jgi:rhodanese-related sulfurtransferase
MILAAAIVAWSTALPTVLRFASDAPPRSQAATGYRMAVGPYCGILSLYAALKAEGLPVEFASLVDAKYVGSERGSTLAELEAAARDHGVFAQGLAGLTGASLRTAEHPIILHVRRPGQGTTFNHWVLFLGCEGNTARIVDPPQPVELVPMAELLAHWDGVGLVVSREPLTVGTLSGAAWIEAGFVVVLLFLLMALARFVMADSWISRRAGMVGRVIILIAVAVLAAVAWHSIYEDGILANPTAVGHVAVRHFTPELPTLDIDAVQALVGRPGVTFIDARYPQHYAAGHLPGAVNLPIIANLALRREVIATIPQGNTIVVYCQSARCRWSHAIATDLAVRGFKNVAVYPGGWEEWESGDATP